MILAEFVSSNAGFSYTINQASVTLNTPLMFDAVVVVALIGALLTAVLRKTERSLERWRI